MKKLLTLLMTTLLVANVFAFSGGSGTDVDPYQISTTADLVEFRAYADNDANYYVLTNDIDMTGVAYTNNGTSDFKGVFDGAGYEIQNLTITSVASSTGSGFIGKLTGGWSTTPTNDGGQIKNVGFFNLNVNSDGQVNTGGIVGIISAENCAITNCYVDSSSVTGGANTGGIVGKINNGQFNYIRNCFVNATVSGGTRGGIVGYNRDNDDSLIEYCVFNGTLGTSGTYGPVLGIAGDGVTNADYGYADLSSNYYNTDSVPSFNQGNEGSVSSQANGLTSAEMAVQSNFTELDFSNYWAMSTISAVPQIHPEAIEVPATTSNITYFNIGTHDNSANPDTYTDLGAVTLEELSGDSVGYKFAGWYTDAGFNDSVSTPAIAAGTVGDTAFYAKWDVAISYTAITWGDGTSANKSNVEGATDTIKISYANAEENDSVFVVITAKYVADNGTWNNTIINQKVHCPSGQDSVFVLFTVHDFNTVEDTDGHNVYRVFLTDNGNDLWGSRYDIGADGLSGNDVIYGTVTQSVATSVEENAVSSISLFPNPSAGLVNIELASEARVTIFDLSGKSVFATTAQSGINSFDLSDQKAGLYLLRVQENDTISTIKLQLK